MQSPDHTESPPTAEDIKNAYDVFAEHTEGRDALGDGVGFCATCTQTWTCPPRQRAATVLRDAARHALVA